MRSTNMNIGFISIFPIAHIYKGIRCERRLHHFLPIFGVSSAPTRVSSGSGSLSAIDHRIACLVGRPVLLTFIANSVTPPLLFKLVIHNTGGVLVLSLLTLYQWIPSTTLSAWRRLLENNGNPRHQSYLMTESHKDWPKP